MSEKTVSETNTKERRIEIALSLLASELNKKQDRDIESLNYISVGSFGLSENGVLYSVKHQETNTMLVAMIEFEPLSVVSWVFVNDVAAQPSAIDDALIAVVCFDAGVVRGWFADTKTAAKTGKAETQRKPILN